MPSAATRSLRLRIAGAFLLVLLLALRLPSLIQPAGGDQGLYGYAAGRILAGDVMYKDAWDQKPPGIAFLYAALLLVWPHESIVPAADLAAAALVAWLLILLGRRRYTAPVGYGAALLFLLLGDPYLQRLSGIYVRGQCEPFMALAITAALVALAGPRTRPWSIVGAGLALGAAFWLKYNSAAYAITLVAALWAWRAPDTGWSGLRREFLWLALGFGALAAAVLSYFAAHGALLDLRLATLDYNLRYSQETYEASISPLRYLVTFPLARAGVDMLWFVGGLGALLLLPGIRSRPASLVALAWLAGAWLSIAINGSRSLPNYFVQAHPALALAASAGLATLATRGRALRIATAVLLLAALWRVGADRPTWGVRLASLPGLVENIRYDLAHLRGRTDRDDYLRRFRGVKHDAHENAALVAYVRDTTAPDDAIFVFGFSGGSVGWLSERPSASRFYWSRPVIIGFEAHRPGYGADGLLADLRRSNPALVALQHEEWASARFFLGQSTLRGWLETGYRLERETPMFSVWRRNP